MSRDPKTNSSKPTKTPKFKKGFCNNCEGSGYVYIRDTTKTCPDCNGKGEIPKSERQHFYDYISSFITYPIIFLPELAKIFETQKESLDELKRLKGLLHMDNFALYITKRDGIHPITGTIWDNIGEQRYEYLVKRNLDMIKYLESLIKTLETKYEKSTYENPNHKSFVG